jgi:hypothetical protein
MNRLFATFVALMAITCATIFAILIGNIANENGWSPVAVFFVIANTQIQLWAAWHWTKKIFSGVTITIKKNRA